MKKHVRNFLIFTTLATISMHIYNRIISFTSKLKNLLKTDQGQFYEWKYGRIFYTKSGRGAPILLVHDLDPSSSSMEWSRISKQLAKSHAVYMIDLLGCGRSDKPNLTYTNYLYVQLMTDFIKNVICEKADIAATGSSCSFSIMSCNMDPEYYNKIILINPEKLTELAKIPGKRKNAIKFLMELPIIGTFIYNVIYRNSNIRSQFLETYFSKNHFIPEMFINTYYESAHDGNSKGKYLKSSIFANYTNINIIHALKKINNSIYMIGGEENKSIQDTFESYTNYNSSIETSLIKHSKYLPQLEMPDQLLNQMELFLNSI